MRASCSIDFLRLLTRRPTASLDLPEEGTLPFALTFASDVLLRAEAEATASFTYQPLEPDGDCMLAAQARCYDPTPGRWLEQDPIGYKGGDANLSRYVAREAREDGDT